MACHYCSAFSFDKTSNNIALSPHRKTIPARVRCYRFIVFTVAVVYTLPTERQRLRYLIQVCTVLLIRHRTFIFQLVHNITRFYAREYNAVNYQAAPID